MNDKLKCCLVLLSLLLFTVSCADETLAEVYQQPESGTFSQVDATLRPSLTASISPSPIQSRMAAATRTPTVAPSPTNTLTPTNTPTPTSTPTPTMTPTPLPRESFLGPLNHQAQTENNCGPASVAILLGYYDEWISQFQVNDAGLHEFPSPCQIVRYIKEEYGVEGRNAANIAGSDKPLKARVFRLPSQANRDKLRPMKHLLAAGIPLIAFQRLRADSDVGHYRVINGYDDDAGVLIADDSYLGVSYTIPYDSIGDYLFELSVSHLFIPIYPQEMDEEVLSAMSNLGAIRVYIACFH